MECYETQFTGKMLVRGFWLYVWKIEDINRVAWYVGRTGDSSSPNAASPFGRLSQHLDLRASATAAMLAKNLQNAGMQPEECHYNLLAIGPIFPEQGTFDLHKPYRDVVGLLESELAHELKKRGMQVLGSHPRRGKYDSGLYGQVLAKVNAFISSTNQRVL